MKSFVMVISVVSAMLVLALESSDAYALPKSLTEVFFIAFLNGCVGY